MKKKPEITQDDYFTLNSALHSAMTQEDAWAKKWPKEAPTFRSRIRLYSKLLRKIRKLGNMV